MRSPVAINQDGIEELTVLLKIATTEQKRQFIAALQEKVRSIQPGEFDDAEMAVAEIPS